MSTFDALTIQSEERNNILRQGSETERKRNNRKGRGRGRRSDRIKKEMEDKG